jgi:hypothetical protein
MQDKQTSTTETNQTAVRENYMNGMRILARTADAVYIRIPEALQVPSGFADGQCSCGRCDGSGKWDTLVVPAESGDWFQSRFTYTVHMPDSAVQPFLDHIRRTPKA